MSNSEEQEHFLSIDPHLSTTQTATELSSSEIHVNSTMNSSSGTNTNNNSKLYNLLSSAPTITVASTANNPHYYKQKSGVLNHKTGDLIVPRPIIQANNNNNNLNSSSAAYKITQVGPVIGSNVIVSRMDGSNATRPTSSSPIPIAGPLANLNHINNNNGSNPNYYFGNTNNNNNNISKTQINPRSATSSVAPNGNPSNFYHATANNVTKFTNMTVSNAAGAKNPLKPTHYTVPINSNTHGANPVNTSSTASNISAPNNSIVNLSTHPNSNLSAPNTSGIAPKTTLKASDLIHILPNLFNTLKRRNSNSNASGNATGIGKGYNGNGSKGNNSGSGNVSAYFNANTTNTLAAAVAAAASSSGKPLTTTTAAALVAEQLLNVAASGPFSDDSSPSPPPQQSLPKRIKLHDPSSLQCEVCGKSYKHRNCLSKHMWEHHESWEHTKKVCQTKHQQVQLLEAAQVLAEIVSGVRSNRNSSSSDSSEEDGSVDDANSDIESEDQQPQPQSQTGYIIEDGIREMSIDREEEDENISIGEEITN